MLVEFLITYLVITILNIVMFKYGVPKTSIYKVNFGWFEFNYIFTPLLHVGGTVVLIMMIISEKVDIKKLGKWLN